MAFSRSNASARKGKDLDRPWEAGDSIPAPEALHRDGDSAWQLWSEVSQLHEARFAETAPMTVPPSHFSQEELGWANTLPAATAPAVPAACRREAQPLYTLEGAMLVARRNNRVCPRPERWNALSELLPARKTLRGVQRPPAPPTGAAWAVTPPLTKRLCFREHVEWAERTGVLPALMAFIHTMTEDEWLHMGED